MKMRYCFGVDVGGTTVKLGFFDEEGNLLEKWEIPTRTEDHGKNILSDVAASILDKMKEREVSREEIAGGGIGGGKNTSTSWSSSLPATTRAMRCGRASYTVTSGQVTSCLPTTSPT